MVVQIRHENFLHATWRNSEQLTPASRCATAPRASPSITVRWARCGLYVKDSFPRNIAQKTHFQPPGTHFQPEPFARAGSGWLGSSCTTLHNFFATLFLTWFLDRICSDFGVPGPPKMIQKSTQNGPKILSERISKKRASEFADFEFFSVVFKTPMCLKHYK